MLFSIDKSTSGEIVKKMSLVLLFAGILVFSSQSKAALSLDIKINQKVGNQVVEIEKKISGNYNQDIEIEHNGLKNKIILNLKKFKNITVNGNKIDPVQIDLKLVNEKKKPVGKSHTITSFYNKTAQFNLPSSGIITDDSDISLRLNFEEVN